MKKELRSVMVKVLKPTKRGSKSNSVVLVKSPMGSASAFPFLCY